MDALWKDLPPDLRDAVRRRADPVTWSAMDRAEVRTRRQLADRMAPALARLGNLLHILTLRGLICQQNSSRPPGLTLVSRDLTVRVAEKLFDVTPSDIILDDVGTALARLAPLLRRALDVDQDIAVELWEGSNCLPVLRYPGADLHLHPDHTHVMDLQAGGFGARLKLLLDFVAASPAELYLVVFKRKCSNAYSSIGIYKRRQDARLDRIENRKLWPGFDAAEALAWAAQDADESAPIKLRLISDRANATVASFDPPGYNITGHLRGLL